MNPAKDYVWAVITVGIYNLLCVYVQLFMNNTYSLWHSDINSAEMHIWTTCTKMVNVSYSASEYNGLSLSLLYIASLFSTYH